VIAETKRPPAVHRMRWMFWAVALVLGIGIGVAIKLVSNSSSHAPSAAEAAVQTWPAGARRAPAFQLTDQFGKAVSLAAFHGRPVIVTFIDPLCRNYCPREASILTAAAAQLGKNAPAIVSVSVDPWGDTANNFRLDKLHWSLAPSWRWGAGTYAQLAKVWKSYYVFVGVTKKTIAGVRVRYITHTGAAYLIDGHGDERALFLYPFDTAQVVTAAKDMLAGTS
jgi:cytochrome oxidase Cu insertion factor (SCO1/SenC/PrrC family)